ncbi:hypothetical protein [Vreelandella maris]|uniref:Uncharacterized protein n=1 Tax=Vreelandella maris TaxID=2729617 RepID=A0A7Y6R9U0_9GAMM|nr:hypothetical protein [Halomonas maris]NVF12986.1 hypothetical protein [Halomonas maris]
MNPTQIHAESVQDIMSAIYGLAGMLEQDGSSEDSEDTGLALGRFQRGCMATSIKHLAERAAHLAEIIEEQGASKAGGSHAD